MSHARKVLDMAPLGIQVELLQSVVQTGGELAEIEVTGRPRGFLAQQHTHPTQVERIEVVSGSMKVAMNGREHVLGEGESIEVPAGTPHRQIPLGDGPGTVRIQARPAGRTEAFLEHLAELCATGQIGRLGFPRPVAGAELVLEYGDSGHASKPPLSAQRAFAQFLLNIARPGRPYVFVDEWDVDAPPEAVFAAISNARSYPQWWRPVYIEVEADGHPEVGKTSTQHFKGRLPYHLRTRSTITALDPGRSLTVEVEGDLRGRGTWTLTPVGEGTHVRFDWQVHADRKLLRLLTPILRPALRANHNWAIARAMEGLQPYAQSIAAVANAAAAPARRTRPVAAVAATAD
jgi:quercetin dioxygenase-like cupin family protein/uncharacterized protein YndB with AHSA1/START domain